MNSLSLVYYSFSSVFVSRFLSVAVNDRFFEWMISDHSPI